MLSTCTARLGSADQCCVLLRSVAVICGPGRWECNCGTLHGSCPSGTTIMQCAFHKPPGRWFAEGNMMSSTASSQDLVYATDLYPW